MSSCAALAIVYCAILGQAHATASNAEHLEEYARAFEGDWISEWEMDITIPEVVEKGDKVVVRATTKWILNRERTGDDVGGGRKWKAGRFGKRGNWLGPGDQGNRLIRLRLVRRSRRLDLNEGWWSLD